MVIPCVFYFHSVRKERSFEKKLSVGQNRISDLRIKFKKIKGI